MSVSFDPIGPLRRRRSSSTGAVEAIVDKNNDSVVLSVEELAAPDGAGLVGDRDATVADRVQLLGSDGAMDNDSSIAGNPASFWTEYFGNPGTGIVHRANRLFLGVAAGASGDRPLTDTTWVDSGYSEITADSQLMAINAVGSTAITGASRTSDYTAWTGGAAGGSTGIYGISVNDELVQGGIAASALFETFHNAGVPGVSECLECTPSSKASSFVAITPYTGITGGSVFGGNFSIGFRTGWNSNISAAFVFGGLANSAHPARLDKGFVSLAEAYDTTKGNGGGGIFGEVGTGQSLRWLGAADAVHAEVFGNSAGGFNVTYSNTAFGTGMTLRNRATTGNAWARFELISGSNQPFIIYQDENGNGHLLASGAKALIFLTNNLERMKVDGNGVVLSIPQKFAPYTLATLPSAAAFSGCVIDVIDATGGAKLCRSDGTNWKILNTTTTVS